MQVLRRPPGKTPPTNILQFGAGNFLRGYFDWMVELLNERTDFYGSVLVVKPTQGGRYDDLLAQDGLYHVLLDGIQQGERKQETRLISSITGVIHPYEEYAAFMDSAELDIDFIVSNTTEAGIRFVPEARPEGRCGQEFPAKLTQWLYARWQHDRPGCHVIPLELIEDNGDALRHCVLRYAHHWRLEAAFTDWIDTNNRFYNTLVDRIVSGYPERAGALWDRIGYTDRLLVAGEYYHSLVIQAPPTGVPGLPLHEAGLNVTYTDDLSPYRERKVRLLNGAHTAIVPTGYLAGLDTVGEVLADPELRAYLEWVLYEEIIPSLDQPVEELRDFAADVLDRFRNPSLHHRLLDIALNSTSKFRTRLLPSLLAYHRRFNKLPQGIVRALAALLVFYRGRRDAEAIPLRDAADRLGFFRQVWAGEPSSERVVRRVLAQTDWWGRDLNDIPGLTAAVTAQVDQSRV
ncbi:Altronate oxidoreductase [Neolewinella maritima]|uniref:Altronate oxidoreductase n=1 Tax=Neolewinella maritima TaxID=1383882 RepID=A0ABM9AY47_9BACT|nr:tagaturonate reductase [Neolewinella maritima]CAH0999211.1 Altronate oxidoreductase [Neolewinella maritima]